MRNFLTARLIMLSILATCASVSQATWSEVLYTVTEEFKIKDSYHGFTATQSKNYSWGFSVPNREAVTGSDAAAPWRTEFATKFDNTTWPRQDFVDVFLFAGQRVTNIEEFTRKTGENKWSSATTGQVSRSLFRKTTTAMSYELDWGTE